ncbi:MAG: D-glycero-beta-D-manno-heptose-7-phosphate kinase [Flavobacteriales bacterium]|nr:D-glycero-beta-D-manno-heptose-7-phosphate kinase [Flavobacteriales bacterium]
MQLQTIFEKFKGQRVLVVGDIMLDAYIIGNVSRISPEAPVPVLDKKTSDFRLGGAGNVALNLVALGAKPIIASVIGNDAAGKQILSLLEEAKVESTCIVVDNNRQTTVKTRVIANNQQVIRIDEEQTDDISDELSSELTNLIEKESETGISAIIFEDYNKGVLTENLINSLVKLASEKNIITTVDPKKKNFLAYTGVTLFKPNLKELKEGLNISIDSSKTESIRIAANRLQKELNSSICFVTLSEHGVYIQDTTEYKHIDAHRRNISDVSGAGDSVIATATLCLAAEASISQIAEISNIAGGLACEKSGVSTVSLEELQKECFRLLL